MILLFIIHATPVLPFCYCSNSEDMSPYFNWVKIRIILPSCARTNFENDAIAMIVNVVDDQLSLHSVGSCQNIYYGIAWILCLSQFWLAEFFGVILPMKLETFVASCFAIRKHQKHEAHSVRVWRQRPNGTATYTDNLSTYHYKSLT